jgi:hypothetical protein
LFSTASKNLIKKLLKSVSKLINRSKRCKTMLLFMPPLVVPGPESKLMTSLDKLPTGSTSRLTTPNTSLQAVMKMTMENKMIKKRSQSQ